MSENNENQKGPEILDQKQKNSNKTMYITMVIILIILTAVWIVFSQYQRKQYLADLEALNNLDFNETTNTTNPIYTADNYPRVDGSTATIPLGEALEANFKGVPKDQVNVEFSKTDNAYKNLIKGDKDVILVVYPSDDESAAAKKANVELEITKVVDEGFVFFVNKDNPVDSLTTDQIEGIYSGEITNWKQVGGNDEEIVPFQRPKNSGSQTAMEELVMKDKKLMEPKTENVQQSMSDIIDAIANYDNGKASIGYSYYFYATDMYVGESTKLLKINGVEPNKITIADHSYPYTTAYYAVSAKGKSLEANEFKKNILSARGQKVADEAGYVPLSEEDRQEELNKLN